MNFLRNLFAVVSGLSVAIFIISLGLKINSKWVVYSYFLPFAEWVSLLKRMRNENWFFITLLFSSGFASSIGGVVTAILVKEAKIAYSMLTGFILLFLAILDIVIFPYHPIFYRIGIFLIFFPSSWIGGKIVEIIHHKRKKFRTMNTL